MTEAAHQKWPGASHEPFVGRLAEIELLEGRLARAVSGSGCVVIMRGEGGIGKTALVDAFLQRALSGGDSYSLLRGRCLDQYGQSEAYLPFLDGLGTLLEGGERERVATMLRTYAPTWCLHLPAVELGQQARDTTVGATRERVLREMGDVFEATAAQAPLIGLLEDAHWADPPTLDLVAHLVRRIARQPMLIVVTLRPEAIPANPRLRDFYHAMLALGFVQELDVPPLVEREVGEYLDTAFPGGNLPAALAARLHRRTEGHPLLLRKLVSAFVERRDISRTESGWQLTRPPEELEAAAPESVRDFIRDSLARLDEPDREALSTASVIGVEFTSAILASLMEADEMTLQERLARLDREHRLISDRGESELPDGALSTRYRFAHALYRETLYEDIVSRRRALLHQRVAAAMQRRGGAPERSYSARIALHFERGRDFSAAVMHLADAGRHAASLFAYDEAERYLVQALALLARLPEAERPTRAVALHGELGQVAVAVGRFDEAVEHFALMGEAATSAGSPAERCRALLGACRALFFGRRMAEMSVTSHEALRAAADAADERLQAEAKATVAVVLVEDGGELAKAAPLLEEVVSHARRHEHPAALLEGLAYGGFVDYWSGDYPRALERLTEARDLAAKRRDGFMLLGA